MNEIYEEVANEIDLPVDIVKKVYMVYWRIIKEHMQSLNLLDTNLTEEEFNKLKTNISIYHLGKFYITYNIYKKLREEYENNKSKRDKTNV